MEKTIFKKADRIGSPLKKRNCIPMKRKTNGLKQVNIGQTAHQMVKILAAETGRHVNHDLVDDLIFLGVEEFRRSQKIFAAGVTCTGYEKEDE